MSSKLFAWKHVLPESANVIFSNLKLPDSERCSLNAEIAEIHFASGTGVFIEWSDEEECYLVTLFDPKTSKILGGKKFREVVDVINAVSNLSRKRFQKTKRRKSGEYSQRIHAKKKRVKRGWRALYLFGKGAIDKTATETETTGQDATDSKWHSVSALVESGSV